MMVVINKWFHFAYKKSHHHYNTMGYHSHKEFEILYIHQGNAKIIIQHKIFDLQPGDIVLLNGLKQHYTFSKPSDTYIRSVLEFLPEALLPLFEAMNAKAILEETLPFNQSIIRVQDKSKLAHFNYCLTRFNEFIHCKNDMLFQQNNQSYYDAKIKHLIVDLLFDIQQLTYSPLSSVVTEKGEKEVLVENMLFWITKHYTKSSIIDSLSNEFHISKRYVTQLFREILGITVMDYVMDFRIEHAKIQLELQTKKPISDIALDVGFKNSAHFSRVFHNKIGMPPSKYKQFKS